MATARGRLLVLSRRSHTLGASRRLVASQRRRGGGLDYLVDRDDAFLLAPSSAASHLEAASWSKGYAHTAALHFLPKGYPHTVAPEYLRYTMLTNGTIAIGSAAGVLTTQSLLCAAGLTQSSGAAGAALAGTLNWVLKDGLGQMAAVVSASLISDRFDTDAKRWRMIAAACENAARVLESLAPFTPGAFLLVASVANLGKSVACLAAGATRAAFHRYLARAHNLADLTGKAGSQAIAASLGGTNFGIALSATCLESTSQVALAVSALGLLQMHVTALSLRCLALPTLTMPAAEMLLQMHMHGHPLPTPAAFAQASSLGFLPPSPDNLIASARGDEIAASSATSSLSATTVAFGSANLEEVAPTPAALSALRHGTFRRARHLLTVGTPAEGDRSVREVRVLFEASASAHDVLLALLHVSLVRNHPSMLNGVPLSSKADGDARNDRSTHHPADALLVASCLEQAVEGVDTLRDAMALAGWDVEHLLHLEEADARVVFHDGDAHADAAEPGAGRGEPSAVSS